MRDYLKSVVHPYRLLCTAIYGFFLAASFLFLYFLAFFMGLIWPLEVLGGALALAFCLGFIISRDDLRYHQKYENGTPAQEKSYTEKQNAQSFDIEKSRINHLAV